MTRLQQVLEAASVEAGSLAALARRLEISTGLMSGWINKGVVPDTDRLPRLAEVLKLSQEEVRALWMEAYTAARAEIRARQARRRRLRAGASGAALALGVALGAPPAGATTPGGAAAILGEPSTSYRTLRKGPHKARRSAA